MEYLTINKMMNFWFYIEHLFFYHSQIIPPPKFREEIAQDIKAMIIKNLLKPEVKNDTISTLSLAAATRRIISRYLIGRSTLTDSSQDRELTFELFKAEFWEENIGKLDNLPELVTKKMNDIILADLPNKRIILRLSSPQSNVPYSFPKNPKTLPVYSFYGS